MRATKGRLLTCDPALKEYLVWLDKQSDSIHFLIAELDSTHLFIVNTPDIEVYLQKKVDEWHDANTYIDVVIEDVESGGQLPSGHTAHVKKT